MDVCAYGNPLRVFDIFCDVEKTLFSMETLVSVSIAFLTKKLLCFQPQPCFRNPVGFVTLFSMKTVETTGISFSMAVEKNLIVTLFYLKTHSVRFKTLSGI